MVAKPELLPPPYFAFRPNTAILSSWFWHLNFLANSVLITDFFTPAISGWMSSIAYTGKAGRLTHGKMKRICTYALSPAEERVHNDLSNVENKLSVCHF